MRRFCNRRDVEERTEHCVDCVKKAIDNICLACLEGLIGCQKVVFALTAASNV